MSPDGSLNNANELEVKIEVKSPYAGANSNTPAVTPVVPD
jgi:hypothetical protein